MPEKTIFILPEETVRKIDLHRGDMSRAEFIDFLIDTVLAQEEVKEEKKVPRRREEAERARPAEEYVSRAEFDEFRQSIKDLQKAFIDFFLTYGLELGGKPGTEEQKVFMEKVRKLLEM